MELPLFATSLGWLIQSINVRVERQENTREFRFSTIDFAILES